MTISDRQLDRLRLGELEPEEARELIRELEEFGELDRLDDLVVRADAFLEHYPAGPAIQQIRADLRRAQRAPNAAQSERTRSTGSAAFLTVGALVLGALLTTTFWSASPSVDSSASVSLEDRGDPFITWEKSDIDCMGRRNCRAEAIAAYELAVRIAENETATDIAAPYEAYRQFDKAQLMLVHGGISHLPEEMTDVVERQTRLKGDLDVAFRTGRLNYRNFATRKMYSQMAAELDKLQAHFPDKRCLYNQWAVGKEREMKDDGVYPIQRRNNLNRNPPDGAPQ